MKNTRTLVIIGGIALVILGVVILFRPVMFTGWISSAAGLVLLVSGILRWLDERKGRKIPLRDHPLWLSLLGLILLINPRLPVHLVGIAIGIWAVVSGIGSIISAWRLNKLAVAWQEMAFRGALLVILGILLLVQPAIVSLAVGIPVGIMLIALGAFLVVRHT